MQRAVSLFAKLSSAFDAILLEKRGFNQKSAHFSSYWQRLASLMPLWNQNLALLSKMKASDAVHAVATRTTLCACGDNVPMLLASWLCLAWHEKRSAKPWKGLEEDVGVFGKSGRNDPGSHFLVSQRSSLQKSFIPSSGVSQGRGPTGQRVEDLLGLPRKS